MSNNFIPYGKQWLGNDDFQTVLEVLRSEWLTTGPKISEFEDKFSNFIRSKYAVAVSSGTAALHAAMFAIDIDSGDEVIVPTMTFAATANCIVFQGGTPVFADVLPGTLLINPIEVERKITQKTKAIIAVDYAGHPADYDELRSIANKHGLYIIADACHSIGGHYKGEPVGSIADLNTFSFHPVKNITTGEGGMITTDDENLAKKMKIFRNHGITSDHRERSEKGSWYYEMQDLGYNYRITDFQCALGLTQLKKLPRWIQRRQEIANTYTEAFSCLEAIETPIVSKGIKHAWHLYVIILRLDKLKINRGELFSKLRENNIGVNVHYIPVHLHPYYQNNYGCQHGQFPVSENAYDRILSLPIYPKMTDKEVRTVINTISCIINDCSIDDGAI